MKVKESLVIIYIALPLVLLFFACSTPSIPKPGTLPEQEVKDSSNKHFGITKMERKRKDVPECYDVPYYYEYECIKIPEKNDDEEFEESFLVFFEEFIKNRETQIALINNPLILFNSYPDIDLNGECIGVEEKEYWDAVKLEKDWFFLEDKYVYEGIKTINGTDHLGSWYTSSNIIIYKFCIPCSGFLVILIFKKINDKWCLYEYRSYSY